MHTWNGEGVDWQGIEDAVAFLNTYFTKRKISVFQAKEKFGTVRIYCSLGIDMVHGLVYPGYAFYQWDGWKAKLDYTVGRWIMSKLNKWFIYKWHTKVYRRGYQLAVEKWPHLKREILVCADFDDFIKGL